MSVVRCALWLRAGLQDVRTVVLGLGVMDGDPAQLSGDQSIYVFVGNVGTELSNLLRGGVIVGVVVEIVSSVLRYLLWGSRTIVLVVVRNIISILYHVLRGMEVVVECEIRCLSPGPSIGIVEVHDKTRGDFSCSPVPCPTLSFYAFPDISGKRVAEVVPLAKDSLLLLVRNIKQRGQGSRLVEFRP